MKIHPIVFGGLVVLVFFGIILGFQAAGIWSVSGKVDSSGKSIQPSADDVETIKGWMTLEQITTAFDVSLKDLLAEFNLPADTAPETALKDLESDIFDTTLLKEWLSGLSGTVVPTESPQIDTGSVELTAVPTEHTTPDRKVTGSTTFQNLIDWGLEKAVIEGVLGTAMPDPSVLVKDYATSLGFEFSTIKTRLQAEIDKQ